MRWIVGDIQGCARELERLLREIRFDPLRDELWSVGDLVNRGPDSLAALRLWRSCGGRGVLGNHDLYALRARSSGRRRPHDTLENLFRASDADELLAALRALPALVFLEARGGGPDVWLVHAGLHPAWRDLAAVAARLNAPPHDDAWLGRPEIKLVTRIRCCTSQGRMGGGTGPPESCRPPYRPWDEYYRGETLVVHGHWAQRGHYRGPRTLGLDSGCVYGGPLTAWCQEQDRLVQVRGRER